MLGRRCNVVEGPWGAGRVPGCWHELWQGAGELMPGAMPCG